MPRIRTLKPEHRQHRKVGPLSDRAYRLWVGMILEADDEGRLVCDTEHLRVVVFGYHPKITVAMVGHAVRELETTGLIGTYVNGAMDYAYFPSWKDHQRIDHPTASVLPAPGEEDRPYKKIRIPDGVRRDVAARYGAVEGVPLRVKCHYCREAEGGIYVFSDTGWVAFADLELDHVLPEYRGGQATADNIVLACRKCNRSKGSRILANETGSLENVPVGKEGIGKERIGRKGVEDDTPRAAASLATRNNGPDFSIPASILHALARAPRLHAVALLHAPAWWQAEIRANPGVDLGREILKAEAYLVAHPEKHYRKLSNFLHGWISRADRET